MAELRITIDRDLDWLTTDQVELWIGSEDAPDLASSTPAGGVLRRSVPAWPNASTKAAAVAASEPGSVTIVYTHRANHKCAVLPIGIKVRDAAGNASDVTETTAQLADPPRGVRGLTVGSTGSTGEAQLAWQAAAGCGA